MDEKPLHVPSPEWVLGADPEPVGVEFLDAALPDHVRAFLREQGSETDLLR